MSTSVDEPLRASQRSHPLLPGLRWNGAAGLWHPVNVAPVAPAVLGADLNEATRAEESAFSPVIASRLAGLPGPLLMVESAPPLLVAALTAAGHDVVILMADTDRAARSARWHAGAESVAVVLGTAGDLGREGVFGTVVADAATVDAGYLADLTTLLTPGGRLVLTAVNSGRQQLAERLTDAGLPHQHWDLLFPDVAAPTLLLSEAALDESTLDVSALLNGHTGSAVAPDHLVEQAQGFLVVAGSSPSDPDPVLARFSGFGRRARFRTITSIERTSEGLVVRRARLSPSLPNSAGPLTHDPTDEPYRPGRNWGMALDGIVAAPGWTVAEVATWFRRWARELSRAAGPGEFVAGRFLDPIPRNLLIDGDHGAFIDQEWTWAEELPRPHVVFRALLHSVGSLVDPASPDASVPARLGDLVEQVAELAGEPFGADELNRAWEFERRLQGLVTGTTPAVEHLSRPVVVRGGPGEGPTGATPHTLRRTLAEAGADNEALRADIDTMVNDLDAVVADRAAVRDELEAEIEVHRRIIGAQRDDIVALTAEVERLNVLALTHRRARAEAAVADYERELQDRRRRDLEVDLQDQVLAFHGRAVRAESARAKQARRAARAEAAVAEIRGRLSWRFTRPLRTIRGRQLEAIAWWRRTRGLVAVTTESTPADQRRPRRRGGRKVPQPVLTQPSDDALVDLDFYRARHGDLAAFDDARLRAHYARYGQREGRPALSWLRSSLVLPPAVPDERETVLVVLPDAGALSLIDELSERLHVVTLLPSGGEAVHEITAASDTAIWLNHGRAPVGAEATTLATELQQLFAPAYAVVGTPTHHGMALALERAGVPVVAMISEAAGTADPSGSVLEFFATVSELVHPDASVASAVADGVFTARGRAHTLATETPVEAIDARGRSARRIRDRRPEELQAILAPDAFDVAHYTDGRSDQREFFAREYLQRVHAAAPVKRAGSGILVHRPRPGFHPLAYAESAPGFLDEGGDPFAHHLLAGSPAGRWSKRLIVPADAQGPSPLQLPSILVHGHFHYPDLLPEFLDLLAELRAPHRLVLTTNSAAAADELRETCREHPAGTGAEVLLVPNRGRNLSALLSGPVAQRLSDHELVLHVHSKRSPHLLPEAGERWRDHLWKHLVGGTGIGDLIVEEFARSDRLGLVGPEDRRLPDWDLNRDHVDALVSRLDRRTDLPTHFDFPVGAMFWARTSALRPFVDARLEDADYPAEPLGPDGTPLHALERLIPLVIEQDGYEYAKTHLEYEQR